MFCFYTTSKDGSLLPHIWRFDGALLDSLTRYFSTYNHMYLEDVYKLINELFCEIRL